jgi:Sec-independent protein translocase protein TatA
MLMLNWPIIITVTGISYLLMILFLPFNPLYATIILFGIIAFWSRLPGVGMYSPFYILYFLDFVDFFSLILAVHIGGFQAAIFSATINLGSRMVGVTPSWLGVFKDTIAQFLTCLIIPYIHVLTGGDIFISMIWYSVIRLLWFFPMRLLPVETSFPQFLSILVVGEGSLIIINGLYVKLFGGFLNRLLLSGATFSWVLFLFVTAVILVFYISLFGSSKNVTLHQSMGKYIIKKIRKNIKSKNNVQSKQTSLHDDNMDEIVKMFK